ncbi:hypothetical protein PVX_086885 [Plasmodium vivax]|uniref:Vir protein n=1 Tax=Plasmodium vivax (strain Salvador I) TaxID=126793 RepID=A5KE81_PLAVS|nr:hypothetical protein PVX_086885 [Plasmodium vivax]EDL42297.1 hypothetical protein PVX_086885 [Plasmodium vivax]|eukprot:XP_001608321.1 hypothetical protein [Plasmodium vivax Sal-1]
MNYIEWPNYVCNNPRKNPSEWDSDDKKICEDFIRLFIFMSQDRHTKTVLDINDYKFLNFWLNKKLREKGKEDKFISNFFTYLNNNKDIFDGDNKLKGKLQDISSGEWEKMDLLYNLHHNYSKIRNEIFNTEKEKKCKNYAKNCVEKMEKAIKEYGESPDTEFYDALREFSHLYTYDQYNSVSCRNVNLPQLPKLKPLTINSENSEQDGKGPKKTVKEVKKEVVIKCDEESNTFDIVNFRNTDNYVCYNILLKFFFIITPLKEKKYT